MSTLDRLLAALGVAPALPGARCRGKPHLFDDRRDGETTETAAARHAQAVGLCQHCPSLTACAAWLATLPPKNRPSGVVAGTVNSPKPGRPRKENNTA